MTVSEWQAPEIPQEVLDSIEREAIDALEGEWGDPKAGDPMQVDVIDLETDNDIVSIEVFNRAIFLAHEESEEIQRIHRVCGVLEAATSGGSAQLPEEREPTPTLAELPREDVSQAPAAFDLSSVLKEHRRQGGACALCGKAMTRQSAQKHLATCAPMHDVADGAEQRLVHIRATAPGLPAYWLDCEVRRSAKLEALDSFLRRIWLECCGHLSAFKIGDVSYFSDGYDFGFARALGGFGRPRNERAMNVRLDEALPGVGGPFEYEYDFGSTSSLQLKLVSERVGRVGRQAVRLLARNTPPVWPCAICGQPADVACAYCFQEDTNAFVCKRHRRQHACGEDEGFLPVVNSPRMGICGYTART